MKKLFPFILLLHISVVFSQTKLVSHPLKLKKSSEYNQILTGVDNLNQVFVFVSEREKFHLLKFNSALFFSDSLHSERPDKLYQNLVGYSFDENGNPYVYWASENFKKVIAVTYDLKQKTEKPINYELDLHNESVITTFTENNIFYILSQSDKDDFLKIYSFNRGTFKESKFDFSKFEFKSSRNKPLKFCDLLGDYPLEKMDSNGFNPLCFTIQKSKFYIAQNKIVLTFDQNLNATKIFEIDLSTMTLSQNEILHRIVEQNSDSNSYFHDGKLYQLAVTEEQLLFDIKKYPSGETLKSFVVNQKDSITFKNSPLYIQNGNQKPRDLKTTKKFIRRLSSSNIGLSVYETQEKQLITIGRSKNVPNTGDILMGVSLTVGAAMGGGNVIVGDFLENNVQNIYFESILDKNLQHISGEPEPLAIDYISEFIANHNEVRNEITFHYKDFFILGYYDVKAEQYVLRKFQNGFY